jgi:transposase
MAESRRQQSVGKVLEGWGAEVLWQIVEVSIDLSGNYKGLVQKILPNADIIADRFHVMKLVNQEFNVVRNSVIKANEENQLEFRLRGV